MSDSDKRKILKLIKQYHRKGLSIEKVQELGIPNRLSFLLCAMHNLYTCAYKLFGEVEFLLEKTGTSRFDIKKELNDFNESYDRFFRFFRDFQTVDGIHEMNEESEYFYHQYMRWCQLPEEWDFGDPQNTPIETDPVIIIDKDSRDLRFHRITAEREDIEEPRERWVVSRYDPVTRKHNTLDMDVDKASAQMVANRMSANDEKNIYTASKLITYHEKRVEVLPMKAYEKGKLVGDYRKVIKGTVSD